MHNVLRPVWAQLFVVPENSSLLTRRLRLEAWDASTGGPRDRFCGFASLNLDQVPEGGVQVYLLFPFILVTCSFINDLSRR